MKITIAGTGCVGLTTAVCLAEKGHKITCIDVDKKKIEKLQKGIPTFFEKDLPELLQKNKDMLTFTTDKAEAYEEADVIFICVGTPERIDGTPSISQLKIVCKEIAETINKSTIIVFKTTMSIGGNEVMQKFVHSHMKNNVRTRFVYMPDFLVQGSAVKDTLLAPRIVVGTESDKGERIMREIFKDFESSKIMKMSTRTAELLKYASDDYAAVKISYMNEIANLCELVDADIHDLMEGIGADPKIGKSYLHPGVGFGGTRFARGVSGLHWIAQNYSYEIKTLKAAIEVNENQKYSLYHKSLKYFDIFSNKKIAVLGLTFKPDTDDVRDSTAINTIDILMDRDAIVYVYDPLGNEKFKKLYPPSKNIVYCQTIEEAIEDAEACMIFTEWKEIKNFDIANYAELMRTPLVLDGRNCYNPEKMFELGIVYEGIGQKPIHHK